MRKSTVCGLNGRRPLSRQASGAPLFDMDTQAAHKQHVFNSESAPSAGGRPERCTH
jgi:hypothetical protein